MTDDVARPSAVGGTPTRETSQIPALLDGRMIATAESCTAGRIAEALASLERATDFFRGGLVSYQETVKRELLGVTAESVLSSLAAEQMVEGVASLLDAQVAVSTTGVAGDAPEEGTPPGTVYIGVKVDATVRSRVYRFRGSPSEICDQASAQALAELVAALEARPSTVSSDDVRRTPTSAAPTMRASR